MSVQDLNRSHRRYISVSHAFRSAWTFHQFIQGLRKVFSDAGLPEYPADFQSLYSRLKEVSQNLNEASIDRVTAQLDEIEEGIEPLNEALLEADQKVSPGHLRQFFQRVKNYDDSILSQLIKFYLYTHDEEQGWVADRLDKADYLTTKLCEEYDDIRDMYQLRDRSRIRELAEGMWSTLGTDTLTDDEVAAAISRIDKLRRDVLDIARIDELHEQGLVDGFREMKHKLGSSYFHPKILQALIETNLVLKNRVQELYKREEQRIVAEYQQVFELEREVPIDGSLGNELSAFREAVDRFEEQLQGENVSLRDLAKLRETVRNLVPRLTVDTEDSGPYVHPPEARAFMEEQEEEEPKAAPSEPAEASPERDYVAEQYETVIRALENTNPNQEPRKALLDPEIFGLGLEPREVIAYRRLFSGAMCDREIEELVLHGAALRLRIEQEVEGIKGVLDDSAVARETEPYVLARNTVRFGDLLLRRFAHHIEMAVLRGDGTEARALQILRMRLTRAYAGLWLLVHRRFS